MNLRVLLADDEQLAVERLTALCASITGVEVIGAATNGTQALEMIEALAPDLVLLDIQMPALDGMAVAEALQGGSGPEVIFVTAFGAHAVEAFEVEAADYLLKPVSAERLQTAISRARRRATQRRGSQPDSSSPVARELPDLAERFVWIAGARRRFRLELDHIIWVEAAGDYVLFHTTDHSHIHRATMAQLGELLAGSGLIRVHRSYFVRVAAVSEIIRPKGGALFLGLGDGVRIPVGAHYAREVTASLGLTG